ncbi:hypothetical protein [Acidovorax sp. M2(2025)]|uniref:hypothetical protein n=1 Tax=Acidovorax sp. M2(2025) TaxID=3411355 RepID=UPI003BF489B3
MPDFWIAIFSSSLLSGVVGALIAGAFGLRGKRNDYVNDYFKTIIKRRLEAYERLEQLINALKLTVLDDDQRPYHQVFSNEATWTEVYKLFLDSTSHPLWLSSEVFSKTRELNIMFLKASHDKRDLIEFGKSNYPPIAELREEVERVHAKDMLNLHNVEHFLKQKKEQRSGFASFDPRG